MIQMEGLLEDGMNEKKFDSQSEKQKNRDGETEKTFLAWRR